MQIFSILVKEFPEPNIISIIEFVVVIAFNKMGSDIFPFWVIIGYILS